MNVTTDPHQQNIHTKLHYKSSTCMHTHTKHTPMLHTHTPACRLLLASLWQCVGEKHLGYLHFCPMTTVWASAYHNILMPRCCSANKELHAHWHHPNNITMQLCSFNDIQQLPPLTCNQTYPIQLRSHLQNIFHKPIATTTWEPPPSNVSQLLISVMFLHALAHC